MHKRETLFSFFGCLLVFLFLLSSCSSLPLIGKKKEAKGEKPPEGKTVTVEGMENIKGVNPPKTDATASKRAPVPSVPARKEPEKGATSAPPRPSFTPILPILQANFKRKVAILEFENRTIYKQEKIGDAVSKRLSDKLEATQRVVTIDQTVVNEALYRQGLKSGNPVDLAAMKRAHQSLGIQAFVMGTVTDVSILASKATETSDEETSFATAKVEVRLADASTGNLLRTFIGRSPIFGTKETGEDSRSKAVTKAIDLGLDDILEGFLRQLDLLEWTTTIANIEGDNLYINAGKLSGLRIGDTLEVFEPGKEIIHPSTRISLGWTTGQLKGALKVTDLFGVDAAIGKVVQGQGFSTNDVVKSAMR
jgi:hypothetical protein